MAKGADHQRFLSAEPVRQGTGGDFGEDFGKIIKTLKNHYLGEGETPLLVEQNHDGYVEESKLGQPVPIEFEDVFLHSRGLLRGQAANHLRTKRLLLQSPRLSLPFELSLPTPPFPPTLRSDQQRGGQSSISEPPAA